LGQGVWGPPWWGPRERSPRKLQNFRNFKTYLLRSDFYYISVVINGGKIDKIKFTNFWTEIKFFPSNLRHFFYPSENAPKCGFLYCLFLFLK
jgi:hypothetical protein